MGGFAVDIDWDHPAPHGRLDAMLALIPHRSTAGTARSLLPQAALGEARTDEEAEPHSIVTDGRFSIVGDLRLWCTDGLRARAGGSRATDGMDDRRLLIAAYARTGIGFLDDVDGDFAFVIWDSQRRRGLAVRDRFAAKPLYYERTPTGIRLATEAKQLVGTSSRPPTPNDAAVAEYLTGSYRSNRHTFFAGISKVAPAHYLLADEERTIEHEYWIPTFKPTSLTSPDEVANEFRERLIDSVQRRVDTSHGVVAHLSGGLDSSSITAAATIAASRGALPARFETVSAVFPGETLDESRWINAITATQPFVHHGFVPERETLENAAHVMWETDNPLHNRIRGLWKGTAATGKASATDLVLMGSGGDEVQGQTHILADLLQHLQIRRWFADVHRTAHWQGTSRSLVATQSAVRALPTRWKLHARQHLRRRPARLSLMVGTDGFGSPSSESQHPNEPAATETLTQRAALAAIHHPRRVLLNEGQESEYAYGGVQVSYPFLDRSVVEFVSSLTPTAHPYDGRSKSLTRTGFAASLPPTVLNRRTKTLADQYLEGVFDQLAPAYCRQYPMVPSAAVHISSGAYAEAVDRLRRRRSTRDERRALWDAWLLMQWLEGLGRYDVSN